MRSTLISIAIILVLLGLHIAITKRVAEERTQIATQVQTSYVLSPLMAKLSAGGFKGIASDFLFLRAIVYAGGRTITGMTPEEWIWFDQVMHAATDLDPYFSDPYYFSNGYLPWHKSSIVKVDALLEKGSRYRSWDPMIPYLLAFNNFIYLGDGSRSAAWLRNASLRPGADGGYAALAGKMEQQGNQKEKGILFLEDMIRRQDDAVLRKPLEIRLEALRNAVFLEKAVAQYRKKYRKDPRDMNDLVVKGIIQHIPSDPQGGSFFLDSGVVRSTADASQPISAN